MKDLVIKLEALIGALPPEELKSNFEVLVKANKLKASLAKLKHFMSSGSLLFVLVFVTACSFKSPDKSKKHSSNQLSADGTVVTSPTDDSDGDKILDGQEVERGTNPLVADIPQLQVRFLQNYDIHFFSSIETENSSAAGDVIISSHTRSTDPDFRYRVGEVMLRDISFKSAAEIGKFESHSWGVVNRQDLSWVKYPEVDPTTYHHEALNSRSYFDGRHTLEDFSVKFENTFKLLPNTVYREIKNLKLAFRFYDYEKESYELIHEVVIERVIQAGVAEKVEIEIPNIPRKLIEDNYLKKGEFIISEVVDFDIPDLNTNYQTLMNSVKAKSIPVLVTTPLETRISWVGLPGGNASFQQIMGRIYDNKFTVEDNALKKVEQFESNLPTYTYLSEVKDKDKAGKWFVFTDRLQRHYLEHRYTPRDVISLSYVTGTELASQSEERIYSYLEEATGDQDFNVYPLGNVTPNSEVTFQLQGGRLWGDGLTSFTEEFHSSGAGCRGNCSTSQTHCYWEVNKFEPREDVLILKKDFTGELEQISVIVNNTEVPLKKLVDDKIATATWLYGTLNITIREVSKIEEIIPSEENLISLKVSTFKGQAFNGIKLVRMEGRQNYYCPRHTLAFAFQTKIPVSEESLGFMEWRQSGRWDVLTHEGTKTYTQPFSVSVSSSVTNFHN